MNLCATCRADFASVAAFDKHRVGTHSYTFAQGLRMEPAREDGRRCLDVTEMLDAGMEVDGRGRWAIVADKERIGAWRQAA